MSESLAPFVYTLVSCIAVAVAALLLLTVSVAVTSRRLTRHRARVVKEWQRQGVRILLGPAHANFLNRPRGIGFGGNGTLLLSADALRFAQLNPDREIVIPLKDIRAAMLANRFNGRWGGGPFLIVQRKTGDLTGFQIDQPQRWVDAINTAVRDEKNAFAAAGDIASSAATVSPSLPVAS